MKSHFVNLDKIFASEVIFKGHPPSFIHYFDILDCGYILILQQVVEFCIKLNNYYYKNETLFVYFFAVSWKTFELLDAINHGIVAT